jgi:hypothetical protein
MKNKRSTLENMEDCEKSFDLICDLLKSGANYGAGKNNDIMLDKKKIKELIKQGALHKDDGKQFHEKATQLEAENEADE